MPVQNPLIRQLNITHPLIQAPMAGGATTPELVAAVGEAGALGFLAGAYLQPQQIAALAGEVRRRTAKPFGINLFAPLPAAAITSDAELARQRIAPFHAELGLPAPELPVPVTENFDELLAVALDSGATVFSFTFGILPDAAIAAIKNSGMMLFGTATTVDEAVLLEQAGVDAVVAQGSEAGAHRGTFSGDFAAAMIGTMALVPQIADSVTIPVIASGGIMDGRGVAAALALGAAAVQMGTAFLTCHEAGIAEVYKQAIVTAQAHETKVTRAFSGRPARGIVNRFMREVEDADAAGGQAIMPYPLQNTLTRPLRAAAGKAGRAEFLSLWAGQGLGLARRQSAAELVARLVEESDAVLQRLAG
jgi:nitronate monooxygenase